MGMNTGMRRSLRARLLNRDGNVCHYCTEEMVDPKVARNGSKMMTLEHVVPQSRGGSDDISNLVLACSECNNNRANNLNFCWCDGCDKILTRFYNRRFRALINANKPRVFYHKGQWRAKQIKQTYTFNSWQDAMNYANGEKTNA